MKINSSRFGSLTVDEKEIFFFPEGLLGLHSRPHYFLSAKKAKQHTEMLAEFWRKRWLSGRITRAGVLEEVVKHTLSYPITHGARVQLPEEREPDLFG